MRDLIFACVLGTGEDARDSLRLARSIRTFGGEFCFHPIWMLSQLEEAELPESTRQELYSLGARVITFEKDAGGGEFAFSSYVTAAGVAETLAMGEASFLAFMASDTLVLQPPYEFLLHAGKSLGGCPVHLKLLGSAYDQPPDDFWRLIYQHCHVSAERIYPVQSIVDEQVVRAYINAGLLVVRPERGLLRAWQANFYRLYQMPEFTAFYQVNELYEIFMHQAVLAGSILALLRREEFQAFPPEINYPLHLHSKVAISRRPANLSQLITCRYEDYADVFGSNNPEDLIQVDAPLKDWLRAQLRR